ncbi:MAG: hypothetical protein ABL866_12330 [Devosia sp.]
MARLSDQTRSADATVWGIVALAVWAVAILGANISALIPESVFAGLHSTRLSGANVNQLRSQVISLQAESDRLSQENTLLMQRFLLTEQQGGEVTRRVGALELSIPRLLEAIPPAGIDESSVTASTKGAVTTFPADGGTVSVTQTPLDGIGPIDKPEDQSMPGALDTPLADASAFGVALGPPFDPDEAESVWQSLSNRAGTLLLGLAPLIGNQEGTSGKRLVAGPIARESDASQLCGRFAKVGVACEVVAFIGEPMPLLN